MKKRIVIGCLMLMFIAGCSGEQWAEFVGKIPDPNSITAIGDAVTTTGMTLGRPEIITIGIVIGALALIATGIKKGK